MTIMFYLFEWSIMEIVSLPFVFDNFLVLLFCHIALRDKPFSNFHECTLIKPKGVIDLNKSRRV